MGEMGDMECEETLREIERYVDGECLPRAHGPGRGASRRTAPTASTTPSSSKHLKLLIATKCRGEVLPEGLAERIRERIRSASP